MKVVFGPRLGLALDSMEEFEEERVGGDDPAFLQLLDDRRLPGVLAEDHLPTRTDDLRLQRLIRQCVGKYPVGVNAGFVGERVVSYERLVGGHGNAGEVFDQSGE